MVKSGFRLLAERNQYERNFAWFGVQLILASSIRRGENFTKFLRTFLALNHWNITKFSSSTARVCLLKRMLYISLRTAPLQLQCKNVELGLL